MKINPKLQNIAPSLRGLDFDTCCTIEIDDDGEPCLAILKRDSSDWIAKFNPSEVSGLWSLIWEWGDNIGAKMRAWREAPRSRGRKGR
jgi:hypothetical protein